MAFSFTRSNFPDGFLFGVATAAYQIEGSSFGGAGSSHWDTFAKGPGNVVGSEDGSVACDHFHRWEGDLDLIRSGNFDVYRFSTMWPRVMPDGVSVHEDGLDFYDRLVDGCLARGLKPYLTLYHWDLPSALADKGGWMNRDTTARFADFARVVMGRIGDRVATTATVNEPWCVAWLSHFLGHHAPGMRDIRAAARAMHHILLGHGRAMEVMRAEGHEELGIVLNLEHANPASDAPADRLAAERHDAIYNRWFIEAIMKGRYPERALEGLAPHLPTGWQDDMAVISQPLDWLGINYYTRANLQADESAPWPSYRAVAGALPKTDMGWEIYPEGLYGFLARMARDYTGEMPIVVTENGMAGSDPGDLGEGADPVRVQYFEDHLGAVLRAIDDGVPVAGYLAWSLLDNYEWAFGYAKRFGIVHVDYDTQARTPKGSFEAFRQALARN